VFWSDTVRLIPGGVLETLVHPRPAPQPRAERVSRAEVPWLSSVKLPWGQEVSLLNISSSGMLFESTAKYFPGGVAQFELCGGDQKVVVRGRFVRSEVARVDRFGVKYRAAAAFESEVDLLGPNGDAAQIPSTTRNVADWLVEISMALNRAADRLTLRQKIERGLRQLVTGPEIRIRHVAIPSHEGCESVCFKIPVGDGSDLVLQAAFEPGEAPTDLEFRILQAGAALAAVVLRLGGSDGRG
jgi:hypothetical protein